MNFHRFILPFVLVAALGADAPPVPPAPPPPPECEGFTEAYRVVSLSSASDGILEAVNVDRGDTVRQGQVVAVIESSVERAALEIAKAQTVFEGEMKEQLARLEYTLQKFEKANRLHEQGLVSEDDFKQGLAEKLLCEAGVLKAKENIRLAELEKRRAEAALELRVIRSPIDGVVTDRFLSPGELVTKLNQSKVVAIAQVNPLRIDVLVPGELFGKISPGMAATVSPEILPGTRLDAKVQSVTPVIDAASGTFKVRLDLENAERQLPPGLKCRIRFAF